ncbi:MAG TPA: nuclease-related domain-containing protein [Baekduia sp.]|uniref:nuclease-related domain-containing protein n=1 Tax=Baekduia sp. TaxID=2600305 RepID=UPI002D78BA62|nr:nuclease-related domain-containing protein [Baekduia sp.]HET6506977.1 nuclease-related domain-containing protein [Baekduia sp.]
MENAPAHETAWLLGADGEARVGEVLRAWAATEGFALLIDATPRGRIANVDFIAVGRAGVVVIDVKAWTGRLRFQDDVLWIGRHGKSKDVEGVERQVEQVTAALAAAGLVLPVRGMLCMANANEGLPERGLVPLGSVAVGAPDEVARAIGGAGPLTAVDVDRAVTALCAAFTMHGLIPRAPAAPPSAPSGPGRRAARRRRGAIPRAILALLSLALALHLAGVRIGGTPSTPSSTPRAADLRRALPDLRAMAARAAGGRVRGPAVSSTAGHLRLTFRRGRCRVVVRVPRHAADVVAGARVAKGARCG